MENGKLLGYDNAGWYSAADDSNAHIFGKFQFCKAEPCDGTSAINPGDLAYIKDIHGVANSGGRANEWLNNNQNGWHVTKTPSFKDAGKFAITRWTCGKYCLTGFEYGLGPTCPSVAPALTFNTLDKQACRPVELTEVPCNVRAVGNNWAWSKMPGACGPGDSEHCKYH
jgi:hypothetical protein